jgi:serine/threonine protein kinase
VHTYSLFDRGSIAWFEMELVEGPNLQQELDRLVKTQARFPLVRAYEIALAVSRCVWHAHRHGVLHRDIKPANVLLPRSGPPAARVSDFGIARLADASWATPSGTVTGTPRFASPEALAGQPVGAAHDVYGLCVTLYALFSGGHLPFEVSGQTSLTSLRRLQLTHPPKPVMSFAPDVDRRVHRVLRQGFDPDAAGRPTARKIVLLLERALARVPTASNSGSSGSGLVVRAFKVVVAGLGLLALGSWARFHSRSGRS